MRASYKTNEAFVYHHSDEVSIENGQIYGGFNNNHNNTFYLYAAFQNTQRHCHTLHKQCKMIEHI